VCFAAGDAPVAVKCRSVNAASFKNIPCIITKVNFNGDLERKGYSFSE
jgi:hypothetical protein